MRLTKEVKLKVGDKVIVTQLVKSSCYVTYDRTESYTIVAKRNGMAIEVNWARVPKNEN